MGVPANEPPKGRSRPALRAALELYDDYDLNPLAAAIKTKIPLGEWRRWQTERIPRETVVVAFSAGPRNIWIPCGGEAPGALIALDCDSDEAVEAWREKLGDALEETACVRTGRGLQFLFEAPAGERVPGVDGRKVDGLDWEIKGDGQGVIVPPSTHPTGKAYKWVRGMEARAEAPAELLEAAKGAKTVSEGTSGADRSRLAELLASPAISGGRNNWLAQVAGHLAKWVPYEDAYERLVRVAAAQCQPPLTDEDSESPGELSKTIRSIWAAERSKREAPEAEVEGELEPWQQGVAEPTMETGWLCSGGDRILIQVKRGEEFGRSEWLDTDIKVLGVIAGETTRSYLVELRRKSGERRAAILPSEVCASARELAAWFARFGAAVTESHQVSPKVSATRGDRLVRYLEAQGAPEAKVIPHIGVYREPGGAEGDFVTHDEVIRAAGAMPHEAIRPDPELRDWAPYRYGFGEKEHAQGVVRRVLEFHDETVTAVFGAWWAAVLLKPWLQEWVSQFPIMGLEAPSESGKTTGFFRLMHQLSGWAGSQVNPTRAALRDYLSAHTSGYVWVDDLDALGDREELLRQVTVGGSLVKKAGDHHGQTSAAMRAALALSGESLGLGEQKALLDRIVLLDVPNPKGRKSKDGKRSQWQEIIEFRNEHPNLTDYSGAVVQLALGCADRVGEANDLRSGPGRHGDKVAVLRFGSRLLGHLAGTGWESELSERVDAWCEELVDIGAENVLTRKILPWALAQTEWKSKPTGPDEHHGKVATPALVDEEGVVWFSPRLLAYWWATQRRGQVSQRTDTEEALIQQARALGLGGTRERKDFMFVGGTGKARYWQCTPLLSAVVLERSRE